MIELAEHKSDFGVVTILESRQTGNRVYQQGGILQSEAVTNGISTVPYVHALYGLVRQTRAKRVLMIGCGGGTLATMLVWSGYRVTVVDVNPAAFFFARKYFGFPVSVECHVADGLDYLRITRDRYDVIIFDAYDGDLIPKHLRSDHFLSRAHTILPDNGCFLANVHVLDDTDRGADAFADSLLAYWPLVRILDQPGEPNRNAIVGAGPVAEMVPPGLELWPRGDAPAITTELARMTFRAPRSC